MAQVTSFFMFRFFLLSPHALSGRVEYRLFACIFLDGFDKSIAIFLDLEFADTADETECLEGGRLHLG